MNGLLVVVNYNQELEIGRFLDDLDRHNPGLEVLVVDDGSSDRSPDLVVGRGLRVIRHQHNRGVGAAIRTGIRHAQTERRYEYVLIMSSNGKMRPDEIDRVVAPIVEGRADYVQGSRFLFGGHSPGLSPFRRMAIPVFSGFASAVLGRRFSDITCGFRAYRLSLFEDPRIDIEQGWLDQYEAELYIHYYACRLGLRMIEVPVTIDYSHLAPDRRSKMRPFAGWWSMIRPLLLLWTGLRR